MIFCLTKKCVIFWFHLFDNMNRIPLVFLTLNLVNFQHFSRSSSSLYSALSLFSQLWTVFCHFIDKIRIKIKCLFLVPAWELTRIYISKVCLSLVLLVSETLQYSCLKNPRMEEPGRLQSMGSRRVGHNWVTSLSLFTFMHWRRKWQPTPGFLPGESQGRWRLVGGHLWDCTELDTTEAT